MIYIYVTRLALLLLVETHQDSDGELLDLLGALPLDAHRHILVEDVRGILNVGRLPGRGVALDDVGRIRGWGHGCRLE